MNLPQNFLEWKYCIEVSCGITLTQSFIQQRLYALQDSTDNHTKEFIKLYGTDYAGLVMQWFQQAKEEFYKQQL